MSRQYTLASLMRKARRQYQYGDLWAQLIARMDSDWPEEHTPVTKAEGSK